MSYHPKRLYIPANLDLDQLLKDHPPAKYKGVNADYLAFICDTIIHVKAVFREDIKKNNEMVRLSSRILMCNVYSYRACLDYLIDAGILTTDNHFIKGSESIGYNFTDKYLGEGFKLHELKTFGFKRTLKSKAQILEKASKKNLKSVRHLTMFFNKDKIQIDTEKALAWIANSCDLESNAMIEDEKTIRDRHHLYEVAVANFQSGSYRCTVDDTGHRFHSLLTNLKSELRNFVTFDGKKLISIDIKNSQPYFSLIFFNPSFYTCNRKKEICTLKNVSPELYNELRGKSDWKKLRLIANDTAGLQKRHLSIEKYRKGVLSGQFYEDLAQLIGEYTNGAVVLNREEAKDKTFKILFGNQSKWDATRAYRAFKKNYPDVDEVFQVIKKQNYEGSAENGYKNLSVLLQRIESYMVLEVITKKFHASYPTAPIFTIHDSVITDQEHKGHLREIMNAELKRVIGHAPRLKEEIWRPELVIS